MTGPVNGSVTVNGDGSYSFDPSGAFEWLPRAAFAEASGEVVSSRSMTITHRTSSRSDRQA